MFYVRYLEKQRTLVDPEHARIAALVLAGTRDATIFAQGRGLRAAAV
jgi:hypothetical protein